jgi:hypothetical protein
LIAGINVGDRRGEEDKGDRQHDDIQHGKASDEMRGLAPADARLRGAALISVNGAPAPPAQRSSSATCRIGIRVDSLHAFIEIA